MWPEYSYTVQCPHILSCIYGRYCSELMEYFNLVMEFKSGFGDLKLYSRVIFNSVYDANCANMISADMYVQRPVFLLLYYAPTCSLIRNR